MPINNACFKIQITVRREYEFVIFNLDSESNYPRNFKNDQCLSILLRYYGLIGWGMVWTPEFLPAPQVILMVSQGRERLVRSSPVPYCKMMYVFMHDESFLSKELELG